MEATQTQLTKPREHSAAEIRELAPEVGEQHQ